MALIKPYENGMVEDERVPRRSATTDLLCKWLVHQLVDSYRYPEDWVGHRIVRLERGSSDADIAVLTQWREPFILCTVSSSAEEAEKRLRRVLPSSSASMGLSTDGSSHGTKFLRKGAGGEKLELIPDIDAHSQPPDFTVLFAGRKAGRSVDQTSRYLTGLSDRVANVFFEAHSHIRDIDGMHSDEALDEVCKILFAKMFDEQNPDEEGRPKMQRALYGSTEEFASAVRGVYKTAAETVNGRGSARGENGVFASRLRLTSAALARVVETLQEYDLLASGTDVKGRAFQKVLIPAIRAGMGQYFTPEPVVKFIVRAVAPTSGDTILDPFCGSGHFLSAALEHVRSSALKLSPDVETFALRSLHGIEKSDRIIRVAITDMRLQGDGHSNIRFADALL